MAPFLHVSFASSLVQNLPWRTLPPSPTGALLRSTATKHPWGRGKERFGPGIGSKLRYRGVSYPAITRCFWKNKIKGVSSFAMLKYGFIFLLFKRETGPSKHHTPPDWIHGNWATMQHVNRYTSLILLYRGQKLRSGSRDLPEKSRNPSSAAKRFTLVANRQSRPFCKTWLRIVFTVASTSIYAAVCLRISFGRLTFISCRLGVFDRPPAGDMSPISEPVTRAFRHVLHILLRKNRKPGISSGCLCGWLACKTGVCWRVASWILPAVFENRGSLG